MSSSSDTEVQRLIAEAMAPLHKRIAELEQRVMELEMENAVLQPEIVRLKKNSSNSSSPDSRHAAYPGLIQGMTVAVIDGKPSTGYWRVAPIRFSHDGSHYAYVAYADGHHCFVVWDGRDGDGGWKRPAVQSFHRTTSTYSIGRPAIRSRSSRADVPSRWITSRCLTPWRKEAT